MKVRTLKRVLAKLDDEVEIVVDNRIEQLKATVDYLEQQLAKQAKQLRDADRALILAERILSNLIEDWEGRQGVVSARNSIVRYINKYKGKE